MRHSVSLFIFGALMMFIGIYMIICPTSFMAVALSVFAIYLIFDGVRGLIALFRHIDLPRSIKSALLAKSIVCTAIGIMLIAVSIARPSVLIPAFVYIAAVVFLLSAIINGLDYVALARIGIHPSYLGLEVVFALIISVILFTFPSFIGTAVITISACLIFAAGAVAITSGVYGILFQRRIRSMVRKAEDGIPGQYDDLLE